MSDPAPTTIGIGELIAAGQGFEIIATGALSATGYAVTFAGDVNGDGFGDILIGAPGASGNLALAGDAYVVFGAADPVTVTLAEVALGIGGFQVHGEAGGDQAGFSVSAAGDVNGDGLADLLIGAPFHNADSQNKDAGAAYVVFGTAATTPITLAGVAAGSGGYKIIEETGLSAAGFSVSAAGDVNGDGQTDLLIGVPSDDAGGPGAGAAYVVFGGTGTATVDLGEVAAGIGGFKIIGAEDIEFSGWAVSAAGDVNGDGLADVAIGAPLNADAGPEAGAAYVVFGKQTTAAVNLENLAATGGGFTILGENAAILAGNSVAAIGDLNGDGLADLLIGTDASTGATMANLESGVAYVVYGQAASTTVSLSAVAAGVGGYRIIGETGSEAAAGYAVAAAGDLNGDGLTDFLIGAPFADSQGGFTNADAVYVVYGSGGSVEIRLDDVAAGIGGYKIEGAGAGDLLGSAVAGGSDINGDGRPDLVFGAPGGAGRAYVVFGPQGVDLAGTTADDTLVGGAGRDRLRGIGGNDSLSGGDGIDSLIGGDADDTLDGGSGADSLEGGVGNDMFIVDDAADQVVETADGGIDEVRSTLASTTLGDFVERLVLIGGAFEGIGNALANTLTGNGGANRLAGGDGDDTLDGGGGDDTLDGGSGSDRMLGGSGNDLYFVDSSGDRVIEAAGGGIDTIITTVSLTLGAQIENGTAAGTAGITLSGNALANWLEGNTGGNTLKGGRGADTLSGGDGGDSLDGGDDTDHLTGGNGNDTLYGSGGFDTLAGGDGDDRFVLRGNRGEFNVIDGGDGFDTVAVTSSVFLNRFDAVNIERWEGGGAIIRGNAAGNLLDFSHLTLNAVKGISGGDGADTLFGSDGSNDLLDGGNGGDRLAGNGGNDTLRGGTDAAADRLDGGAGDDQLAGGGGADTLDGGDGADTLDGGAGGDVLSGGAGDDVYIVDSASDRVFEDADAGIDRIESSVSLTLADTVENLTLRGSAPLTATGNSLANQLIGNGGNNTLSGLAGDDTLNGGGGKDTLIGGDGADRLSGGSGDDRFRYLSFDDTPVSGADTIDGFDAAGRPRGDVIDLAAIDANGAAAGDGAFQRTLLFGDQAFTAAGQIRIVDLGTDTLIELNGDEDIAVEAAIVVLGINPGQVVWTADDFLL